MKSTITIEDTRDGTIAVTIQGEVNPPKGVKAVRMHDLIVDAVRGHFHPVKTHFVPVRKERLKR